jgi:predicted glycoside hydrolase/deacetylase ChbG (UPF0249 family)
VAEKPILSRQEIPSITCENGLLMKNYFDFFLKLRGGKVNLQDVENELDAQIRRILENGIMPSHLDSHQYVHMLPSVLKLVIKLANKYKIRWIRYPCFNMGLRSVSLRDFLKMAHLLLYAKGQKRILKEGNISYPDFTYGVMNGRSMTEKDLSRFLFYLRKGVSDITCHPGYKPENDRYASWKYSWETQLTVLKSEKIKHLIRGQGIRLTNYAF